MSTATLPAEAISFVCTLVRQHSAIELDSAKAYLIESRLGPVAKKHGYPSIFELVKSLIAGPKPELRAHVVEAMTTNETSFYRDTHPFDALKHAVLPEMLRARATQRTLNIWSAACSTGQEAYSIAMLIRDHFTELNTWKLNILGTDLSDDVLDKARAATYSQIEMNRGLPATLLAKHFLRDGLNWQLNPKIRQLVSFARLNLIERWPVMPVMDVVFLRNVLIYFSPATKKTILEKVRATMAPHSVLFLGAAETTMNLDAEFSRVQNGNYVYYCLK